MTVFSAVALALFCCAVPTAAQAEGLLTQKEIAAAKEWVERKRNFGRHCQSRPY